MKKYFLLAFIASLICIFSNPSRLAATDSVLVRRLDDSKAVETVVPEPVMVASAPEAIIARAPAAGRPVAALRNVQASAPSYSYAISVAGRTISIVDVSDTLVDAGNHVNHIGKLYYGHNSAAVFGGLSGLGVGSVFSITQGGIVTNYRVAETALFTKNLTTGTLQINGTGSYMRGIKNNAWGHSVALMTCAGQPLGNGDATHRLVIFADAF